MANRMARSDLRRCMPVPARAVAKPRCVSAARPRSTAYRGPICDPAVLEEIATLRTRGYTADFGVTPDVQLRCDTCGHTPLAKRRGDRGNGPFRRSIKPRRPGNRLRPSMHRCGLRVILVAAYGPTASAAEPAVLTALLLGRSLSTSRSPPVTPGPLRRLSPGPLSGAASTASHRRRRRADRRASSRCDGVFLLADQASRTNISLLFRRGLSIVNASNI